MFLLGVKGSVCLAYPLLRFLTSHLIQVTYFYYLSTNYGPNDCLLESSYPRKCKIMRAFHLIAVRTGFGEKKLQIFIVNGVCSKSNVQFFKNKIILNAFTKIDKLTQSELQKLKMQYPSGIFISNLKNKGIENLENALSNYLFGK